MILFIAMVLVAAVASAVLIALLTLSGAGHADRFRRDFGTSAGFNVEDVYGSVANNSIDELDVYLNLVPGSPTECVNGTIVTLVVSSHPNGKSFSDNMELNKSNSYFSVNTGELEVYISNINISPNDKVEIRIIPPYGSMSVIDFTIPQAFCSSIILLR